MQGAVCGRCQYTRPLRDIAIAPTMAPTTFGNSVSNEDKSRVIQFILNNQPHTISAVDPTLTLLQWLRYDQRLTGTKEGCAEGDCGACTVVIGELRDGQIIRRAMNACILFMPMLDGREVTTVEHLQTLAPDGALHPVQQAMVDEHGSQCGFCTPGIIMTLYAMAEGKDTAPTGSVNDALAGNLCRCTGYGPIQRAGETAASIATTDTPSNGTTNSAVDAKAIAALEAIQRDTTLAFDWTDPLTGTQKHVFAPRTRDELAEILAEHPTATLVAGATDVGLWVTKHHQTLDVTVSLNDIASLREITDTDTHLTIGAGVKYSDAWAAMTALHPDLGELVRRIGAVQVRNAGTIGGNIANGSPIGDSPPALIALGATLVLHSKAGPRRLPLEDFFLDYGKQDLRDGEFVAAVEIPKPTADQRYGVYKLSKRFDQDISAVCAAFRITSDTGTHTITDARIAFGGMAATPKRAVACEAALVGQAWTVDTARTAAQALATDFTPISDMRASADYRMITAQNLLVKFAMETGIATQTQNNGAEDLSSHPLRQTRLIPPMPLATGEAPHA